MSALEVIIVPLLHKLIHSGDECYEYLDNAVHIMSYFTYYNTTISPLIFTLCGPLLAIMDDWGFDYMSEIMVPILNYISKVNKEL